MKSLSFTLATYHVKQDKQAEFVKCWRKLADVFAGLERPPYWGTLIQSRTQPQLFHSFGPWENPDDIAAMRANAGAAAAFGAVMACCEEMTPGDYAVVEHVRVQNGGDP